jgi:two-component system, OmpR family, sensor histidine kinase MprB
VTLRAKLILGLVAMAAVSTIAIGASSYLSTRDQLYGEIDRSLEQAVTRLLPLVSNAGAGAGAGAGQDGRGTGERRPGTEPPIVVTDRFERPRSFEQILVQVVDGRGVVVAAPSTGALPVGGRELELAGAIAVGAGVRRDVVLDGEAFRQVTVARGDGRGAVMVARSLDETRRSLGAIRRRTVVSALIVTAIAGTAGWLVARQLTRRLLDLTRAAEEVATTSRLDVPVELGASDETGRLATAFRRMLDALARSKDEQQRLVQDAGHELRTPLTSLRTNIAVLQRFDRLSVEDRERILADLDSETRELGHLVEEIVVLASGEAAGEPVREIELAVLAERAAERVRRRSGRTVVVSADRSRVMGRVQALERAITNLLDNAVKFSEPVSEPAASVVELTIESGRVSVCDRGPGIPAADLPRVFDRFHRAPDARSRPGSGLGLSIVRDAAESHGGTVFARPRVGGGVCVGFELPIL